VPQFDALALHAASADSSEIVRWIEAKAPLAIGAWDSIGPEEYARAFTAAGTAGSDVVADIYAAMLQTIRDGGTEQDFAAQITPILVRKGWLPGPGQTIGSRVQLIYDTNLRVARAIGRWDRVQGLAHVMPYLQAQTVGDRRVRDEHVAFNGVVLPVNHPFWTEFWPPLYFRCRCDVVQLTRGQFARRKLAITGQAEVEQRAALIRPQSWGRNVALNYQQEQRMAVDAANARRLPGAPPLDAQTLQQRGRTGWQAIMGLAIQQLLTGLVESIS
jgi:SPP1 gp7 family putative phage head morphogenesis protein